MKNKTKNIVESRQLPGDGTEPINAGTYVGLVMVKFMPSDLSFISGHIRMSLCFNESKILSQPFFYPHSVSKIYIQIITVWVATHSLHIVFHGVPQQCVTVSIRASLTTATWRCRKNFSQWERSCLWKLRYHWLKDLPQLQIDVVRQGPGG